MNDILFSNYLHVCSTCVCKEDQWTKVASLILAEINAKFAIAVKVCIAIL